MAEEDHFSPYRSDGKLFGFVCVVAGADTAIGAAVVAELVAHGAASIYACTSTTASANLPTSETAQVIHYPHLEPTEHSTLALIDEALNAFGRLDVWVCASSTPGPSSIASTTPSDIFSTLEVNTLSAFFALKYAPAAMQKMASKGVYSNAAPKDQAYGSIIVITSIASEKALGGPALTISSHAALGVVRSGVPILKGTGVRINAIAHSGIESSHSAKGTNGTGSAVRSDAPGSPEEVGKVVGFLASGFSRYINGSSLKVDGGQSVI